MITHHTVLLTAGVLLAALGTPFSSAAMADRNAPLTDRASQASPDDAKPTTPSRIRTTGGTEVRSRATTPNRPTRITQRSRAQASESKPNPTGNDTTATTNPGGKQSLPALPTGHGDPAAIPNLDIQVDADNKIIIRDLDTDRTIIDTRNQTLWTKAGPNSQNWVTPSIEVIPTTNGFDIEYEFTNNTGQPALIGNFDVPGINMPTTINTRHFNLDMRELTLTRGAPPQQSWASQELRYPRERYAPVIFFADDEYSIGISIQYPILEYRHAMNLRYRSISHFGGDDIFWSARMHASMDYSQHLNSTEEGSIQPGETRNYSVSVRIIRNGPDDHPNRWLQTFLPYREYFQSMYGGVKYNRDPRPIQHLLMAARELHSDPVNNPRSYTYGNSRAPDRYGFGPWAQVIRERMDAGMERFNLLNISGAMWEHTNLNSPFLVSTPFFNEPAMAIARDSVNELQSLQADGAELNFWWGRSAQYMDGWDTGEWDWLDPQNPEHRQAAINEIQATWDMGGRSMGLDAFEYLPEWESYPYLLSILDQFPDMKFVIEPMSSDVLHTVAPGFVFLNRPAGQEHLAFESPNAFADFLVPGHETWGLILSTPFYQKGLAKPGKGVPDIELRKVAEEGAANGYSVLLFGEPNINNWNINAAEPWLASVPADLRQ